MTKEPQAAPDTQEVLEKYDRDSTTRQFDSKSIFWIVTLVAVLYSLFHLYMVFNPMPALQQRSIHVAVGCVLRNWCLPSNRKRKYGGGDFAILSFLSDRHLPIFYGFFHG